MIYEYSCPKCVSGFERNESMMDDHTALCPNCGEVANRRYSLEGWLWRNPDPLFHQDGSYELKF